MSDKNNKLEINKLIQRLQEIQFQREDINCEEDAIQTQLLTLSSERRTTESRQVKKPVRADVIDKATLLRSETQSSS